MTRYAVAQVQSAQTGGSGSSSQPSAPAVAGQPMRFSLNPQWNLKDITGATKARIVLTATVLAPAK